MIAVLGMIVFGYVVLGLAGWALLALVPPEARDRVAPAAPVLGAALAATVASTATRWLAVPAVMALVAVLLVAAVVVGWRLGHRPWVVGRAARLHAALAPVLALGGAAVALVPTAWVGDHRPVASTIIVDQFYFAAVSEHLQHEPMLPAPYWTSSDWVGSAQPSLGPVVDVIANRLRYGQGSVSAMLSSLLGVDASDTVAALSVLWIVLLGGAVLVAVRLLGGGTLAGSVAAVLATTSVFTTSQSLEGKNDGLLGLSLAVLVLGLTHVVAQDRRYAALLVVAVGGLAATYSELVLVLAPGIALLVLLRRGPGWWGGLNRVAGAWALGVVVAPFAWIWLAESAAIAQRFNVGNTPWDGKTGVEGLRVALGVQVSSGGWVGALTLVVAVVGVVLVVAGLVAAAVLSPARGAAIGVTGSVAALLWGGVSGDAGNLVYRTAQFGAPLLLVLAVVGWSALWGSSSSSSSSSLLRRARPVLAVGVACCLVLASANAASAVTHLSRERAEVQHVPDEELDEAVSWVRSVDGEDVSVVVPRFTDLLWLALALRDDEGVGYPVVPAIYLGNFPRWDRQPDRYYLVGVGAQVTGEARVVHSNDRYALVELGPTGAVLTPFQPTYGWARPTYMRGAPCARTGAQALLLRGSSGAGTFALATPALPGGGPSLRPSIDRTERIPEVGRPRTVDGWTVSTYRAPRFDSAVIDLELTPEALLADRTAVPVVMGDRSLLSGVDAGDPGLVEFCLADDAEYMDGYDTNLTLMR